MEEAESGVAIGEESLLQSKCIKEDVASYNIMAPRKGVFSYYSTRSDAW